MCIGKKTRGILLGAAMAVLWSMTSIAGAAGFTKPGASPAKNGSWEVTGTWTQDEGGYRFTESSGRVYEDEWLCCQGSWYYIGLDHYMKTGWFQEGDNWYYFDGSGAMHKGWLEYDGTLYFMSEQSGEMRRTGYMDRGSVSYKFADSGIASALVRSTGNNQINSWYFDGTGWVFINSDWTCKTGCWFEENGNWYHFDVNGRRQTGWLHLNSGSYYLGEDGVMLANTKRVIDGVEYTFGPDGRV